MVQGWKRLALVGVMVFGVSSAVAAASTYNGYRVVNLMLDGRPVKTDVPPIIVNDRTLLPVRALAEALGNDVKWDGTTYTASIISRPRLDTAQAASGVRLSLQGITHMTGDQVGDSSVAARVVTTVRLSNNGTTDQQVDLSRIRFTDADSSTDPAARTFVLPHVLEVTGSRTPAAGTTSVVVAPGDEITAKLGYDLSARNGLTSSVRHLVMVNEAGDPEASLSVTITITIDCGSPCKITITIDL